jgi:hypothetical protein
LLLALGENRAMKVTLLILFVSVFSFAYAEPIFRTPDSLKNGERGEYLPKSSYKIIGVDINSASLDDIEKVIGDAQIYKGQHTANHLCYANDDQNIEFSVSSLGFGYKVARSTAISQKCTRIGKSIENDAGLKIGLLKSEVLELLGNPTEIKENSISYTYWVQETPAQEIQNQLRKTHKLPSDLELWLDIYSQVNIGFSDNIIDEFSIHTTETY